MRVAIVHDFINRMGDAERVLLALHNLLPHAPIYTSIWDQRATDKRFRAMDIRTSSMQRLPFILRRHRSYLPLYPFVFERLDLREYDLVISLSRAFAKGVVTRPEALHICYCQTPMPWAWRYEDYVSSEDIGGLARVLASPFLPWLRSWDYTTAGRVDYFLAGSQASATRIAKYYRRESTVILPPVDTAPFQVSEQPDDYFLVVSRLTPDRHVDLAAQAFARLGLPLRVVGAGRDEKRLRRLAGKNVRFLGALSEDETREQVSRCRALIVPGTEDFSFIAVAAQACGRPVIAYGAGGALATIIEGETGVLFAEQTVDALMEAVEQFRDERFDPRRIRRHAEEFDTRRFLDRLSRFVEAKIASHPILARQAGLTYSDADAGPRRDDVSRRSEDDNS
jgi:glycosyltransferase involved in cell wall biosynthesis